MYNKYYTVYCCGTSLQLHTLAKITTPAFIFVLSTYPTCINICIQVSTWKCTMQWLPSCCQTLSVRHPVILLPNAFPIYMLLHISDTTSRVTVQGQTVWNSRTFRHWWVLAVNEIKPVTFKLATQTRDMALIRSTNYQLLQHPPSLQLCCWDVLPVHFLSVIAAIVCARV